jgi:signal transduction histidine kinase
MPTPGRVLAGWGERCKIGARGREVVDISHAEKGPSGRRQAGLLLLQLAVILPTVGVVGVMLWRDAGSLQWQLWVWTATVALVEVLPVPAWRGLQVSVGFPLLMAVAFVFDPPAAALAAFLGASDPREYRRQVGLLRAVFNRSQVALSVLVASSVFHALAGLDASSLAQLGAALLAAVLDYFLNSGLVTAALSLDTGVPPLRVIKELRIGRLSEFLVSYLGLAFFGLFLAHFASENNNFWAIPVFVIPLLLARQMFFRSMALEEAHRELKDREQVLRVLSTRMAEERQDERMQIAAFLHDDLAQLLFRLSIQVDVARRRLDSGEIEAAESLLGEIKETKNRTSDRIRALIRDLHRSPLGRAGLAEALHSFIAETGKDSDVQFHTDIDQIDLPAPIALLMYHIAREAVMNALKHARASNMWLTVKQDGDEVEMVLRDDGVGFDSEAPEPEGHYGLTMMRERATVGGGSFAVKATPGEGASITVRFPTSWLQAEPPGESPEPSQPPPNGGASPDTLRTSTSPPTEPVHA